MGEQAGTGVEHACFWSFSMLLLASRPGNCCCCSTYVCGHLVGIRVLIVYAHYSLLFLYMYNRHLACVIEDFVETHVIKLRVMHPSSLQAACDASFVFASCV